MKQAFRNADINRDKIYLQLPIGLDEYILNNTLNSTIDKHLRDYINQSIQKKDYSSITCRLNKALYRLKQASRQ
jgi:hypothetical protein